MVRSGSLPLLPDNVTACPPNCELTWNFYTAGALQYPYRSSGPDMDIGNMGMMKFLNDTGSYAWSQILILNLFIASFFVIISLSG